MNPSNSIALASAEKSFVCLCSYFFYINAKNRLSIIHLFIHLKAPLRSSGLLFFFSVALSKSFHSNRNAKLRVRNSTLTSLPLGLLLLCCAFSESLFCERRAFMLIEPVSASIASLMTRMFLYFHECIRTMAVRHQTEQMLIERRRFV